MIREELKEYDYRENLIIDEDNPILIQRAWRDHLWGKNAGHTHLTRLHGEDALTWNVFRTLQLAGKDGLKVISDIFGISKIERILFWGCDVEHQGEEQQLLNILIRKIDGRHRGTMTEPDLVIITEGEVVFVECKLNQPRNASPWKAQGEGAKKRMKTYIEKFPELKHIDDWETVYQLIRQYVYAKSLSEHLKKKPVIIPLVNGAHKEILSSYYSKVKESPVNKEKIFRAFTTWQDTTKIISASNLSNKEIISAKVAESLNHAR